MTAEPVAIGLRIAEVERLTGIGAHTLRAWERRYGVPTPDRSDGKQRMYSFADVELIRRMRNLAQQGVPLSRAARTALQEQASQPEVSGPHPHIERLLDALLSFDERKANDTWNAAVEEGDLLRVFNTILIPVLRAIGEGWHGGGVTIAQEHFASNWVRSRLESLARQVAPMVDAPVVVLACPSGERHELGLLMLNALLRFQGLRTVFLGQDMPAEGLIRVMEDVQPAVLAVHGTVPDPAFGFRETARRIAQVAPLSQLVFGGAAFPASEMFAGLPNARHGGSGLADAVAIINSICRMPATKG